MTLRLSFCALFFPMIVTAQTFTDVTPSNITATESGDVAWADYNNDGYLDFAIMGRAGTDYFAGIYTGAGDGTFTLLANSNLPGMRSGDLDWGDFDNDGDLDLAMIGERGSSPWEVTIIMRNDITSFQQHFITSGSEGGSLVWFDYDNDRDLDLYQVGTFFSNMYYNSVFINTDGNFSNDNVFYVKGYYSELGIDNTISVATDFDADGDQDIFSSGQYAHGTWNTASLLVNNGVQDIENTSMYRFSYNDIRIRSGSVNQADFNKDGKMDYILTGNSTSISVDMPFSQILFGTGDGNFQRVGKLLDVYYSSSDVGDIDNDGDMDIILSGQTQDGVRTAVYLNNGSGQFSDSNIGGLAGLKNCSVALGDYDNDGDLDILMTGKDQANARIVKLYRNNLLAKAPAPNEKPGPPSNLRFRMENNSLIMEWDKGTDKETPSGSLTYNVYVAIAAKTPFKLFPQADAQTGKRRVHEHGNASGNTQWSLKGLKTGTYYFSVQTIDGANEGSVFAPEVVFKYTKIDATAPSCANSEQTFSVSPAANYTWTISGGTIVEGQGSEKIRVKWDAQPVNPKITASNSASSNSLVPTVNVLPPATISGPDKICSLNTYADYRPVNYIQDWSYLWDIDGIQTSYPFRSIEWTSPGDKLVKLTVTDPSTGCFNSGVLNVKVSAPVSVSVLSDEGLYFPQNTSPTFKYKWEGYVNERWDVISTDPTFRPAVTGYYTLTITNENDCVYVGGFYVYEIVLGIEDEAGKLQLAPNPATTSFSIMNVHGGGRSVNISVVDMAGRSVFVTSTQAATVEVDCSSWRRGLYMVVLQHGRGVEYSKVFLK